MHITKADCVCSKVCLSFACNNTEYKHTNIKHHLVADVVRSNDSGVVLNGSRRHKRGTSPSGYLLYVPYSSDFHNSKLASEHIGILQNVRVMTYTY